MVYALEMLGRQREGGREGEKGKYVMFLYCFTLILGVGHTARSSLRRVR